MRHSKSPLFPLFSLLMLACGAETPPAPEPLATRAAPLTSAVAEGCLFELSARTSRGPMPPVSQILLTRRDAGGCATGGASTVLGTTYDASSLSLTVGATGVAVAFSSKATPSGSAAVSLQVVHLNAQTLEAVRGATLSAWNPFHAGSVHDGELSLGDEGTTLEVRGTKNGIISGEEGTGGLYVARYPDFFTSATPPRVTAWEE